MAWFGVLIKPPSSGLASLDIHLMQYLCPKGIKTFCKRWNWTQVLLLHHRPILPLDHGFVESALAENLESKKSWSDFVRGGSFHRMDANKSGGLNILTFQQISNFHSNLSRNVVNGSNSKECDEKKNSRLSTYSQKYSFPGFTFVAFEKSVA